jgi:hypothetical protein
MKQKRELAIFAVLIVVAVIVWYFQRVQPAGTAVTLASGEKYDLLPVDNPGLHWPEVKAAQKTGYQSTGRNIFSMVVTPPPPPPPPPTPDTTSQKIDLPPPPPPPVTLPVKFFGFGTVPNGATRRAFLTDGEEVFIVGEGDVLLNRFRILKIGNASIEFEEISSGRRNTAPLEEQPASPSA